MATRTVITCDICGTEKQETNGWFSVGIEPAQNTFHAWHPPDSYLAPGGAYRDCCGSECAHKAFSRWMSHGTLEERA